MFGRATIRLGIGPHSSFVLFVVFKIFPCCMKLFGFLAARMLINICICSIESCSKNCLGLLL